jgi:predicted RNase H-like nuclease (RuvC/YqgF family)
MKELSNNIKAEDLFREAFERLKANKPINVPVDSKVSQNMVGKEAMRHSTALKIDRYPLLVLEIQSYIESQKEKAVERRKSTDNRSRTDKQKLKNYKNQIDKMASVIDAMHNQIETLESEVEELKQGIVRPGFDG